MVTGNQISDVVRLTETGLKMRDDNNCFLDQVQSSGLKNTTMLNKSCGASIFSGMSSFMVKFFTPNGALTNWLSKMLSSATTTPNLYSDDNAGTGMKIIGADWVRKDTSCIPECAARWDLITGGSGKFPSPMAEISPSVAGDRWDPEAMVANLERKFFALLEDSADDCNFDSACLLQVARHETEELEELKARRMAQQAMGRDRRKETGDQGSAGGCQERGERFIFEFHRQ